MKALSVKQPWASVLCAGIKDVENRTWQTKGAPGRILIHATKTKVESNYEGYPDDYISTIKNARTMGQIPEYKDMPYGSIIGYLDCYQIVRDAESYWAQPDSYHWCVKDAYLFDEPTSRLDALNEAYILQSINELVSERDAAVVLVSHRASTMKIADEVLHMQVHLWRQSHQQERESHRNRSICGARRKTSRLYGI